MTRWFNAVRKVLQGKDINFLRFKSRLFESLTVVESKPNRRQLQEFKQPAGIPSSRCCNNLKSFGLKWA